MDIYKGLWATLFGPNAGATQSNAAVVNNDGSLSVATVAAVLVSAGAAQVGLSVGTGAAVGLTPPAGAQRAQIMVSGQAIRYRDDGTDPTTTVGVPVAADQTFTYTGPLSAVKFIAQTGTATLDILYYR